MESQSSSETVNHRQITQFHHPQNHNINLNLMTGAIKILIFLSVKCPLYIGYKINIFKKECRNMYSAKFP